MIMPSRDIHCILSVPDDQASTDERNEMPFKASKTLVIKVISVIAINFCSASFGIQKLDMRIEPKNSLLEVQQLSVGVLLQGWG